MNVEEMYEEYNAQSIDSGCGSHVDVHHDGHEDNSSMGSDIHEDIHTDNG
jgi:hypothetical protein